MNTLSNFAEETGVDVNYMTVRDGRVYQDYWYSQGEYVPRR
jgi:hypothetical protein